MPTTAVTATAFPRCHAKQQMTHQLAINDHMPLRTLMQWKCDDALFPQPANAFDRNDMIQMQSSQTGARNRCRSIKVIRQRTWTSIRTAGTRQTSMHESVNKARFPIRSRIRYKIIPHVAAQHRSHTHFLAQTRAMLRYQCRPALTGSLAKQLEIGISFPAAQLLQDAPSNSTASTLRLPWP